MLKCIDKTKYKPIRIFYEIYHQTLFFNYWKKNIKTLSMNTESDSLWYVNASQLLIDDSMLGNPSDFF